MGIRRSKTRLVAILATSTVLLGGPLAVAAGAADYDEAWKQQQMAAAGYTAPAPTATASPTPSPTASGTSTNTTTTANGTSPTSTSGTTSPTATSSGTDSATSSTTATNTNSSTGTSSTQQTTTADSTAVRNEVYECWGCESITRDLVHTSAVIGATDVQRTYSGTNVGVALIDTGVAPVLGLSSGNVVNGPDLSFESQSSSLRYLDSYGHGTHMAGIIAGNEGSGGSFRGIAPGARLTSVKVAGSDGAVDVSQVIAAVDWVVAHRNDNPSAPIRVLNLSYGTDGVQSYKNDPLTHAVENAWRAGIVVVVAGGNSGTAAPKLNNPAYDPYVLAVGASDSIGTTSLIDDRIASFSSRGDSTRRVDLVVPGRSVVSLRNEGSALDDKYPAARVDARSFKGSGTSQAAAIVSGAVALLLQARPGLTPDQVKAILKQSATAMPRADATGTGSGTLHLGRALAVATPSTVQTWAQSTGLGKLDLARGTQRVAVDGVELSGERHILGSFDVKTWAPASKNFTAWSGGTWAGAEWTGTCWCESTWAGTGWTGKNWSGKNWSGKNWSEYSWSGKNWSGKNWSGTAWSGKNWSGKNWSGKNWSSIGSGTR